MANFITVFLDTTAPSNPTISLNGGSTYANDQFVDCIIGTTDGDTSKYQMKLWGDVDLGNDTNVQGSEVASKWVTFTGTKQVRISDGNGQKTISLKIRDEVHNESAVVSDSITYDATKPVVTVTAPDVTKISTIGGKDVVNFSFTVSEVFVEYKVKVVNSSGATEETGSIIPVVNGSINTSGTGAFDTTTEPITVSVNGQDLQDVSSGDGLKTIKVFVRDESGLWSS